MNNIRNSSSIMKTLLQVSGTLTILAIFLTFLPPLAGEAASPENHEMQAPSEGEVLPQERVERVSDEAPPYSFEPFQGRNLSYLEGENIALEIAANYPRLDGATSAYPIYAVAVEKIYKGLNQITVSEYVRCSRTAKAYNKLLSGDIDVFFGLEPSQLHLQMAADKGIEFTITPIAKDGFVFLVNRENPVDSLTIEQIQDIYQKKIVSWDIVGGNPGKIMPFQRSENSGSQTIMLAEVMKGKPLPPPLMAEYFTGMLRNIREIGVAPYRNYASAIGYSFYYYATGMFPLYMHMQGPSKNVKLLGINGIHPTKETIRSGTYPLTVNVYAITTGNESENTKKLIEWLLSEQGQRLIEQIGYVGL